MTQTKIKTITVKESTYSGKVSKSYSAVLEDGTTGYIDGKVAGGFKEGETVDYVLEVKQNKSGKDYNLLTLSKMQQSSASQSPKPQLSMSIPQTSREEWHAKSYQEMKFESRMDIIELITRLIIAGKLDVKDAKQYFVEWVEMVDISIDELKG